MKIVVLLKMVPDVVEELEIAPAGKSLAGGSLHWVPNESDEHALEQALLLKERYGATVTSTGNASSVTLDKCSSALSAVVECRWCARSGGCSVSEDTPSTLHGADTSISCSHKTVGQSTPATRQLLSLLAADYMTEV